MWADYGAVDIIQERNRIDKQVLWYIINKQPIRSSLQLFDVVARHNFTFSCSCLWKNYVYILCIHCFLRHLLIDKVIFRDIKVIKWESGLIHVLKFRIYFFECGKCTNPWYCPESRGYIPDIPRLPGNWFTRGSYLNPALWSGPETRNHCAAHWLYTSFSY